MPQVGSAEDSGIFHKMPISLSSRDAPENYGANTANSSFKTRKGIEEFLSTRHQRDCNLSVRILFIYKYYFLLNPMAQVLILWMSQDVWSQANSHFFPREMPGHPRVDQPVTSLTQTDFTDQFHFIPRGSPVGGSPSPTTWRRPTPLGLQLVLWTPMVSSPPFPS